MAPDDDDAVPQAAQEGTQEILGVTMRSYVLEDGRRVFHADDVHRLLRGLLFDEKPEPESEDDQSA